ncbi:MAG: ORF6N domain-containing protein [Lachnospiraceae bacterium]|nr:ORF6N domain-containing protein [Lachnospiraceae bacterium]MDY4427415.1 ORF6N domain-containing protein [Lachnospiraceae bacterium]MDY5216424.1 ORF6N domain-containing protein [Lachnospiraceae bacterium]MDY5640187.1 ORF6N domain-containing protein [Lachnospiraceae bacterium]
MAEDKKNENEIAVIEVTEEYLKDRLYMIRGKRVLLDADLAIIYGYTTKAFNQQVKNNIEKFDEDFMFELSDKEVENLRSKFLTANISSKSRYNPRVFTEQGLYMLMTVLKGSLAVKQSKALIRTFKKMKDYILENRDLIGQRELLQLSMETANNKIAISKINHDMSSLEKQISDVAEGLKDVVTKSELADMMNSFISDDDEKWLMYNAKFSSADEVYESIYRQAKSSIYVVDNYIGLRTLVHLKNSPAGVDIILFSDNVGNNKLHNIEFTDFCKEYPAINISMQKTGGIFHDRFIVLDYGTADERVFLCGASSKDAGARITSIVEDYGTAKYNSVIAALLKNSPLILPK